MPRPKKVTAINQAAPSAEVKTSLPPLEAVVPDEAVRMAKDVFAKWGATAAIRGFYVALAEHGRTATAAELPDIAEARHVAAMRKVVPLQ